MTWWCDAHIYLQRYKVIAVGIILFFAWQSYYLTTWYTGHFMQLSDWQNAPVIGLITAYVAALKFALEHILKRYPTEDNDAER